MTSGFHVPANIVGIAGDWHGNTGWAIAALDSFHENNIRHVFHLGDFGFWGGQDGAKYVRKVTNRLERYDMFLYVTLGNHENYWKVYSREANLDGTRFYDSERLIVLPRGFKGNFGDTVVKDFISLGGANSIDYKTRKEGLSWWREESITYGDIDTTINAGHADFMFCHELPDGVNLNSVRKSWQSGWDTDELFYSEAGRKMLRIAVDYVKPGILFHGHHHVFHDSVDTLTDFEDKPYSLRTIGLTKDEMESNIIAFNIVENSYDVLKVKFRNVSF